MLLTEFNSLSLDKKSDLVWEWGHYVATSKRNNTNVVLFIIHDFFVEVYLSLPDNKTTDIKGVSKDTLDPEFLKSINLEDPFVKVCLNNKGSSRTEVA